MSPVSTVGAYNTIPSFIVKRLKMRHSRESWTSEKTDYPRNKVQTAVIVQMTTHMQLQEAGR